MNPLQSECHWSMLCTVQHSVESSVQPLQMPAAAAATICSLQAACKFCVNHVATAVEHIRRLCAHIRVSCCRCCNLSEHKHNCQEHTVHQPLHLPARTRCTKPTTAGCPDTARLDTLRPHCRLPCRAICHWQCTSRVSTCLCIAAVAASGARCSLIGCQPAAGHQSRVRCCIGASRAVRQRCCLSHCPRSQCRVDACSACCCAPSSCRAVSSCGVGCAGGDCRAVRYDLCKAAPIHVRCSGSGLQLAFCR
jgi:hypothetical protein